RRRRGACRLSRHGQDVREGRNVTAQADMGAGTQTMLEVEGLDAWYGAARILFDVSLHVGRGEVVALMGRNGAGKSTTIKAIMGFLAQRRGKFQFCCNYLG